MLAELLRFPEDRASTVMVAAYTYTVAKQVLVQVVLLAAVYLCSLAVAAT
jgi:hypothetical protein